MAQPQRQPIPFGRHSSHFVHIENHLVEVLTDIKAIQDLSPKILWVSCRLNRTGQKDSPVFVGWVEDAQAVRRRVRKGHHYSPIDIRFGDSHPSDLYRECLNKAAGQVVMREWVQHSASSGSQEIGRNFYDETHRRSIAVRISGRAVGTLNAGFRGDPTPEEKNLQYILLEWAQGLNSDLLTYIEQNLECYP
jgi:hypothetical protein